MQENDKQKNPGWKLWFKGRGSLPSEPQWEEHPTEEDALRAACEMLKVPGITVLHIEQPNGPPIELEAIRKWCDGQPKTG